MPSSFDQDLRSFRLRLAKALVRLKINYRDDLRALEVLWNKLLIEKIVTAERALEAWREFLASPAARRCQTYSLYLNIPYCRQKCTFCKFPIRIAPTQQQINAYIDDTLKEMRYFSPAFSEIPFLQFQVGGGTPSLLNVAQINRLIGETREKFRMRGDGLLSIELHPASTTFAKLAALRRLGFNRVSFGVQSLDPALLARIRREDQTETSVRRAIRWAREARIPEISVELVAGLRGDSAESFMRSFRTLAEEKPSSISINQLNLTEDYMKAENTRPEDDAPRTEEILARIYNELRATAPALGYNVDELDLTRGIAHLSLNGSFAQKLNWKYCEATACVLGLGQPSWSHIVSRAWYSRTTSNFSLAQPLYKMRPRSSDVEMASYIHYHLINSSRIDFDDFKSQFDAEFPRLFQFELELLSRFGRLRVDERGAVFLPKARTERFFYGSIFFIRHLIKLRSGTALTADGFLPRFEAFLIGGSSAADRAKREGAATPA